MPILKTLEEIAQNSAPPEQKKSEPIKLKLQTNYNSEYAIEDPLDDLEKAILERQKKEAGYDLDESDVESEELDVDTADFEEFEDDLEANLKTESPRGINKETLFKAAGFFALIFGVAAIQNFSPTFRQFWTNTQDNNSEGTASKSQDLQQVNANPPPQDPNLVVNLNPVNPTNVNSIELSQQQPVQVIVSSNIFEVLKNDLADDILEKLTSLWPNAKISLEQNDDGKIFYAIVSPTMHTTLTLSRLLMTAAYESYENNDFEDASLFFQHAILNDQSSIPQKRASENSPRYQYAQLLARDGIFSPNEKRVINGKVVQPFPDIKPNYERAKYWYNQSALYEDKERAEESLEKIKDFTSEERI